MTSSPEKRIRDSFHALVRLAGEGYGYFTTTQARKTGYSWASLKNHLDRGRIRRVARGVYRLLSVPTDRHSQEREVLLQAGDRAVLSHESALAIHNLSDIIPHKIHISLPRSARWRSFADPVVRVHFVSSPIPRSDVETIDGMPVTKPARTIVDCIEDHSTPEQMQMAVTAALQKGVISGSELGRIAENRKSYVRKWLAEYANDDKLAI